MKSASQCKTQVSALIQKTWNEFLMLSILPNPTAWEWGCQSVVLLSNVTADGSGPYRTTVPAQPFDLLSMGELPEQRFTPNPKFGSLVLVVVVLVLDQSAFSRA